VRVRVCVCACVRVSPFSELKSAWILPVEKESPIAGKSLICRGGGPVSKHKVCNRQKKHVHGSWRDSKARLCSRKQQRFTHPDQNPSYQRENICFLPYRSNSQKQYGPPYIQTDISLWLNFLVSRLYFNDDPIVVTIQLQCISYKGCHGEIQWAGIEAMKAVAKLSFPKVCLRNNFCVYRIFLKHVILKKRGETNTDTSLRFRRWRMPSSGMWCRAGLVRTDVSKESIASIIRVERISELATPLAVTEFIVTVNTVPSSLNLYTLMTEATVSSETSVLTRTTSCHPRRRHSSHIGTLIKARL
jgi:hypothetical protein